YTTLFRSRSRERLASLVRLNSRALPGLVDNPRLFPWFLHQARQRPGVQPNQRGQSFPRPDHPDTSPATGRWAFSSSLATSRLLPGPTPGLFARSLPLFKVTVNLHNGRDGACADRFPPAVRTPDLASGPTRRGC